MIMPATVPIGPVVKAAIVPTVIAPAMPVPDSCQGRACVSWLLAVVIVPSRRAFNAAHGYGATSLKAGETRASTPSGVGEGGLDVIEGELWMRAEEIAQVQVVGKVAEDPLHG